MDSRSTPEARSIAELQTGKAGPLIRAGGTGLRVNSVRVLRHVLHHPIANILALLEAHVTREPEMYADQHAGRSILVRSIRDAVKRARRNLWNRKRHRAGDFKRVLVAEGRDEHLGSGTTGGR